MSGSEKSSKSKFDGVLPKALLDRRLSLIRKIFIGIAGFTVLAIGVAMMVLPGPAFIVIPLGLAILATEFVWAKSLLNRARQAFARKSVKS
jgi:tellurite resistance protein TerC